MAETTGERNWLRLIGQDTTSESWQETANQIHNEIFYLQALVALPCHLCLGAESNYLREKKNDHLQTKKNENTEKFKKEKFWWKKEGRVNVGALHVTVGEAEGKDALSYAD